MRAPSDRGYKRQKDCQQSPKVFSRDDKFSLASKHIVWSTQSKQRLLGAISQSNLLGNNVGGGFEVHLVDRQVALASIHGRCQGGGRVTIAKQRRVALVNGLFLPVLTWPGFQSLP